MTCLLAIAGRVVVAAAAVLAVCASAAYAAPLKLSDVIQLRDGTCRLTSDATDQDSKQEARRIFQCTAVVSPDGFLRITVAGAPDETIFCQCKIAPNGAITGTVREGVSAGAYSARAIGQTKPGTPLTKLPVVGGIIRIWELASAP